MNKFSNGVNIPVQTGILINTRLIENKRRMVLAQRIGRRSGDLGDIKITECFGVTLVTADAGYSLFCAGRKMM